MTRSEHFTDALLNMIMSADEDVQTEFRAAYNALCEVRHHRFPRSFAVACSDAFDMIDEANAETSNPPAHKANSISL